MHCLKIIGKSRRVLPKLEPAVITDVPVANRQAFELLRVAFGGNPLAIGQFYPKNCVWGFAYVGFAGGRSGLRDSNTKSP